MRRPRIENDTKGDAALPVHGCYNTQTDMTVDDDCLTKQHQQRARTAPSNAIVVNATHAFAHAHARTHARTHVCIIHTYEHASRYGLRLFIDWQVWPNTDTIHSRGLTSVPYHGIDHPHSLRIYTINFSLRHPATWPFAGLGYAREPSSGLMSFPELGGLVDTAGHCQPQFPGRANERHLFRSFFSSLIPEVFAFLLHRDFSRNSLLFICIIAPSLESFMKAGMT